VLGPPAAEDHRDPDLTFLADGATFFRRFVGERARVAPRRADVQTP
jgi:hypothetical protein